MIISTFLFAVIGVMIVTAAPTKWIDLSYPFVVNETVYWPAPANTPFQHKVILRGEYHGAYILSFAYGAGEHGGTHIDAPNHFAKDGISLEKIQIDRMVGEGVVVDISAKAKKDPNAELTISDLEDWEKKHGRMPDEPVVFLYSGWGKFYPDRVKFFGTNDTKNASTFNFPGLSPGAATWLIKKRNIKVFGIDTPSFDTGNTLNGYPTHLALLGAGVPGIEMTANLHLLPPRGFEVMVAPMKIKGGSGGPTRIYARIADKMQPNTAMHANASGIAYMIIAMVFFICLTYN